MELHRLPHFNLPTPANRWAAALFAATVLAANACSSAGESPAANPTSADKPLNVAMAFLDEPLDPVDGGFQAIRTGIAETLVKLGPDLSPQPWLAAGFKQTGATTWDITLRPNAVFHDGTAVDANAVRASLLRALAKAPGAKALLRIAEVSDLDTWTVRLTTEGNNPILPSLLADPALAVVQAADADAKGAAFGEKPVLTGPFQVDRFQIDNRLEVRRFDRYWGGAASTERVVFTYLPDSNSRSLALRSGDIDIADYLSPENAQALREVSGVVLRAAPPVALEFLYLNHRKETLRDPRVRQALSLGIDRGRLHTVVLRGNGAAATDLWPAGVLQCNGSGYRYDPAQAGALLDEAGFTSRDAEGYRTRNGQQLTLNLLTYRQRPELPAIAETVQANLKTIGVKVNIRLVEAINAALQQGDWDAATYFNNLAATGDPYSPLAQFYTEGGGANRGDYRNPKAQEMVRRVGEAQTRPDRIGAACAATAVITQDLANIPLVHPAYVYGVSAAVTGFDQPHPFFLYLIDRTIGKR